MRVFVSTEDSSASHVAEIIGGLSGFPGVSVETSPRNPLNPPHDPRWRTWYASGCAEAIEAADCFWAIETTGDECSSWMAHEFDVAWKLNRERGRPRLFVSRSSDKPCFLIHYDGCGVQLPINPTEAISAFFDLSTRDGSQGIGQVRPVGPVGRPGG